MIRKFKEDPLYKIIKKLRNRGDISHETLDYFSVNNPKLGRFYLLPKVHKRLHGVPGKPVISNSGFYTENMSSFIQYHLRPLAQNVKPYIKDTNDFLCKLANLPPLPDDVILCTIDVVGLYPNIPHDERLIAMWKALDLQKDKRILTESLIELAECVLKNNIFEHNLSFYRQLRRTAIGTKMVSPYAIIFLGDPEEIFFSDCDIPLLAWWRYIDDIFCFSNMVKKSLRSSLKFLIPIIPQSSLLC